MTPLPHVPGAGLASELARTVFPESQREVVRTITPWEDDVYVNAHTESREGGATRTTYVPTDDSPVQARIDPTSGGTQSMRGAVMHEDTTHVITFRVPRDISAADRVSMHGRDWLITAVRRETDEPATQVEVVEA